ncbi:MAG: lactate racemase domain-containing protein [Gemmatales bacterium]
MTGTILHLGNTRHEFNIPDGVLVHAQSRQAPEACPDVAGRVTEVLEAPLEFPALRRALTPDDHICIVVHDETNGLGVVMQAILEHVQRAGVAIENVNVLVQSRRAGIVPSWQASLPDQVRAIQVHEYDRAASKLAYLASTKEGRRIYLNRLITDADQLIIVGSVRFDEVHGITSGLAEVFPAFSDEPTFAELTRQLHFHVTGAERQFPIWKETEQVGWLLGMPFVVCVAEGEGDKVSQIFAGGGAAVRTVAEQWLRQHRVLHVPYQVDLVIGTVAGDVTQQHLGQVATAAYHGASAVRQGGIMAVLSTASGSLPPGADVVSASESIVAGLTQLRHRKEVSALPWWQLAHALEQGKVYVSSHLLPEVVESLFLVPLDDGKQAQRLIDQAKTVLLVDSLDRTVIEVGGKHR